MSDQLLHQHSLEQLIYTPSFTNDAWFATLRDQVQWQQNQIRVFGKWHLEPRLTAWFGPAYKYSSVAWPEQPVPEFLAPLLEAVKQKCDFDFNAVLLNYYRNGHDAMGWHSDNEPEMDPSCIASLSLGQPRWFHLKHRHDDRKIKVWLESGSLLVMRHLQRDWLHAVPRSKRFNEGRINLTFRRIIG